MASVVPRDARRAVIERARDQHEYCQKPDDHQFNPYRHEVDHAMAEKHGGSTELDNLAYACFQCNHYKGSGIASLDPQTGEATFLFNPRTQIWDEHFQLNEDGAIAPRTATGRVTARLLRFNDPARVQQRADLIAVGVLSSRGVAE
jgi:hypothetical protein